MVVLCPVTSACRPPRCFSGVVQVIKKTNRVDDFSTLPKYDFINTQFIHIYYVTHKPPKILNCYTRFNSVFLSKVCRYTRLHRVTVLKYFWHFFIRHNLIYSRHFAPILKSHGTTV